MKNVDFIGKLQPARCPDMPEPRCSICGKAGHHASKCRRGEAKKRKKDDDKDGGDDNAPPPPKKKPAVAAAAAAAGYCTYNGRLFCHVFTKPGAF